MYAYEGNEIKVPKKQKIIAYIFLFLVIITFSTMRSHKIKKTIENNLNLKTSVETSISESLNFLYNENLNGTSCVYIDEEYRQNLIDKFKETNSIMAEESLTLSHAKLSSKHIYKTKIEGEPFIIYSGEVDLSWSHTNKDSSTDPITKEITVYLKNVNKEFRVADIKLKDIK